MVFTKKVCEVGLGSAIPLVSVFYLKNNTIVILID